MPDLADYLKINGSNALLAGLNFPNLMFSELTANRLKLTTLAGGVNYRDLMLRSLLVGEVIRGTANFLILGPDAVSMNTHDVRIRSATGGAYVTHLDAVGGVLTLENLVCHDLIPETDSTEKLGDATHWFWTAYVDSIISSALEVRGNATIETVFWRKYSDATRPPAGNEGRQIYNTSDDGINTDDGTNWRDTNGNIT